MEKYDVIIVGAGLGGLVAGAKLALEGKKVLLADQHDRPGGCATTFTRKEFTFEVGLHEMDGLDPRDLKTRVFRELDVFEKVRFLRVPEFYHFIHGRTELVMPHDPGEARKRLGEKFPGEKEAVDCYFDRLLNARQIAREHPADQSVGAWLDSLTGNEELKLVLTGNLGYFSDDPYRLSLNYYSVAQGSYFTGGGNFIRGGSQQLSDHLANLIRIHGGTVLLNHLARQVHTEGTRATGVILENRKDLKKRSFLATADVLVVNAALPALARELLPPEKGRILNREMEKLEPGPSLLSIYFGFKKPLKEIGSTKYSCFVFDPSVRNLADISLNNRGPFEKRSFTFVDYSQVDSGLAPEGKSTGTLCCIDYLSDWKNLSPPEYRAKKEYVTQVFIDRLDLLIPGFRNHIEYVEAGTASTVERYTLNPGGAVYGFARLPGMEWAGATKALENLYIASAWGRFGGGFSGAIYSGYMCALDVIRRK